MISERLSRERKEKGNNGVTMILGPGPEEIRYSTEKVEFNFQCRPPMTVIESLQKLRRGDLIVEDLEPICVTIVFDKESCKYYSLDHRRLWVFKQLGRCIPVRIWPEDEEC